MQINATNFRRNNPGLQKMDIPDIDDGKLRKEGFWDVNNLPFANRDKWKDEYKFLVLLLKRQEKADKTVYRGVSACSICKQNLQGNTEYRAGNWIWNNTLYHYVETHNVKPTPNFIRFVCRIEEK